MGSNLPHILIIAEEATAGGALAAEIKARGYTCTLARNTEDALDKIDEKTPLLVLVTGESGQRIGDTTRDLKKKKELPVIALLEKKTFTDADGYLDAADDFMLQPCDPKELNLRIKRILRKTGQEENTGKIGCGDLSIDPSRCEVTVAGRTVELTFREYELLRFLAANPGRVFTRDALLDRVWGYDYYGGDRTVDVHIRRLRSKIESPTHRFIDTVRNIGYRFIDRA